LVFGFGTVLALSAGSGSAVEIQSPRDGETIREKVRIVVPSSTVPSDGFVGLYIDSEFIAAQARDMGESKPVVFIWDTKQLRGKAGRKVEERTFADGEHLIEVRSYNQDGNLAERDQASVLLNNRLPVRQHQPVHLEYKFRPEDKTKFVLRTEMEVTNTGGSRAPTRGAPIRRGGGGPPAGIPGMGMDEMGADMGGMMDIPGMMPGMGGIPARGGAPRGGRAAAGASQSYIEFRKVSVHVADALEGSGFLRDYPENPVTTVVNGNKQAADVPAISRYYRLDPQGEAELTLAMQREDKEPVFNVIGLPPHSVRIGDTWQTQVNISLGAHIPERIEAIATNVVASMEWELGKPTARIESTYDWNGQLSIPSLGIEGANCKFKGTSIIHFAPETGKPLRAVHTIDGDMVVGGSADQDLLALAGGPGRAGSRLRGAAQAAKYHAKIRATMTAQP
jgi:hypothetical protein